MVKKVKYYVYEREIGYESFVGYISWCYGISMKSAREQLAGTISKMIGSHRKERISEFEDTRIEIEYV